MSKRHAYLPPFCLNRRILRKKISQPFPIPLYLAYHIPLQRPHGTKLCLSCLSIHDIVNAYQLMTIRILILPITHQITNRALSQRNVRSELNRAELNSYFPNLALIVTNQLTCNKAEHALRDVSKPWFADSQLDGVSESYAVRHQSCLLYPS